MEIRIEVPEDFDQPLAPGVGEIQVRGDNVCLGYNKLPEINKHLFTTDGWMRTGDLGRLDKRGNLFILGRSKTMILGEMCIRDSHQHAQLCGGSSYH